MVLPYLCGGCPVQPMLGTCSAHALPWLHRIMCVSVYNLIPFTGPYLLSNFVDLYYYNSIVEDMVDESKFIRGLYGSVGCDGVASTVMMGIDNSLLQDY
jgi:hypothetical protein